MHHGQSEVAVVTGSAQGIGRRTAEVLAGRGFTLLLNDLQPPRETLAAVEAAGARALVVTGDVSLEATALQLAETARREFGRVDVLVNNAGVSLISPAEQTTAADWRHVLDINLLGPFLLCRELGALMLAQRRGSIINVASRWPPRSGGSRRL